MTTGLILVARYVVLAELVTVFRETVRWTLTVTSTANCIHGKWSKNLIYRRGALAVNK